ncbi:probable NADH-cytochrome b5 reductase 2 [Cephalotrichum gorgonifer]|uniref:NADH-cytochrome b5 reductase n=1 Tax=Cephalotrichum gorgonifer TaxID=2041049 RepID=A0AAE8T041_9PEZI|nr:probable NADH-cytochrome b5 reductase 2 [Cephalotrichum gorgonifer]
MFARSAVRTFQPLRCQAARRYATSAPTPEAPKSGSNAFAYAAGAAGLAGAAYYFLTGSSAGAKAVPAGPPKKALTGGDQGFVSLTLDKVEDVNHNTKLFRFKLPEDDMVSGMVTASAILTKFKPEGAEKAVLRPYTPVSDEDAQGRLDLLIKKYKDGPMSTHIHSLKPGDTLDVKGPLPKYPWTANKHSHIALIAGGTGITPMYQLLRSIFSNPADKTKVTLIFGNIAEEDILLRRELADLENTYPQRFRAFYVLDNAPKGWIGGSGHVTKELLKTTLPEPKEDGFKVFVCGPPGMMKAISGPKKSPKDQGELTGLLQELGYNSEQVYKF